MISWNWRDDAGALLSKVLLLARDRDIRDPNVLEWIRAAQRGSVT